MHPRSATRPVLGESDPASVSLSLGGPHVVALAGRAALSAGHAAGAPRTPLVGRTRPACTAHYVFRQLFTEL